MPSQAGPSKGPRAGHCTCDQRGLRLRPAHRIIAYVAPPLPHHTSLYESAFDDWFMNPFDGPSQAGSFHGPRAKHRTRDTLRGTPLTDRASHDSSPLHGAQTSVPPTTRSGSTSRFVYPAHRRRPLPLEERETGIARNHRYGNSVHGQCAASQHTCPLVPSGPLPLDLGALHLWSGAYRRTQGTCGIDQYRSYIDISEG